mmetsp:Transcript_1322/g.3163  ORF Transcript_1322/g.3163 Transcript_1322/m.3163 type:complete len:243 (-) Transcript_1322:104-832(-)
MVVSPCCFEAMAVSPCCPAAHMPRGGSRLRGMLLVKRGGGPRRVGGLGRTKKGRKGGRGNAFVPGACHVGPEPHGCHPLKDVPLAHLHHLQKHWVLCWGQDQATYFRPGKWESVEHVRGHGQRPQQPQALHTWQVLQELEGHARDACHVGGGMVQGQGRNVPNEAAINKVLPPELLDKAAVVVSGDMAAGGNGLHKVLLTGVVRDDAGLEVWKHLGQRQEAGTPAPQVCIWRQRAPHELLDH